MKNSNILVRDIIIIHDESKGKNVPYLLHKSTKGCYINYRGHREYVVAIKNI